MTATDYDNFAHAYSAENEANLFNAYYERPEMLRLAGDVSGRRILDAGCGCTCQSRMQFRTANAKTTRPARLASAESDA